MKHRCALALAALTLSSNPGWAQAGDRLRSADCQQALAALSASEAAAASASAAAPAAPVAGAGRRLAGAVAARLDASKALAAKACLGIDERAATNPPRGTTTLPAATPAAPGARAPAASPLPTRPGGVPLPSTTRPVLPITTTSCDAAGCWASDGTRLNRLGSTLVGPRGVCTQAAGVLNCP